MTISDDSHIYEMILSGDHVSECRVVINNVAYGEDMLISLETDATVMTDEAPSIGNSCAGQIRIDMLVPQERIPENAKIVVQKRIRNGTYASAWTDAGHYWIDTRKKQRNAKGEAIRLEISGYDGMARAERDYTIPEGTWSGKTDAAILAEICTEAGITSDWTPDKGYTIGTAPDELNGREIIGYIAGMYGGNAVMGADGRLKFVPLNARDAATHTIAESMYTGDALAPIDSVVVHDMVGGKYEAYASQGEDGFCMNFDCPWATQAMAENILAKISGYRYMPYEINGMVADPRLHIGDTIKFFGITERVYTLHTSYHKRLICDVSAPDRKEATHDFKAPSQGGGGGGGGKSTSTDKTVRFARKELIADIGDARSGIYAIASADDIKHLKDAHTTMFAQVLDENNEVSVSARLTLTARETASNSRSVATLQADVIKLEGNTEVVGNFKQSGGVVTCNAPLMANSIATGGQLSGRTLVVNSQEYTAKNVTFASGAVTVLAV